MVFFPFPIPMWPQTCTNGQATLLMKRVLSNTRFPIGQNRVGSVAQFAILAEHALYLGFGAGAHGCAGGMRISNVLRIKTYLDRFHPDHPFPNFSFPLSPATVNQTQITRRVEMQETMLTGLRLTSEGVSEEVLGFVGSRFGVDEMVDVFGQGGDRRVLSALRRLIPEWICTHSRTFTCDFRILTITTRATHFLHPVLAFC